jgi:hypothetical protein
MGTMSRFGATALLVGGLVGCGESSTETTTAGELRFSFSGDTTGSFEAVGFIPPYATLNGTFATGAVEPLGSVRILSVLGQRERIRATVVDLLHLSLSDATTGSVTCVPDEPCAFGMAFVVGGSLVSEHADGLFAGTGGTVVVSALDGRRARGTFDVTMREHAPRGAPRSLRVAGSFDVPLTGL